MTNIKREQIVVASFLEEPDGKPGPAMCAAIANSPYWDSPEAFQLALGIGVCLRKNWKTTRKNVSRAIAEDYRDWVDHPMFADGLPLSCAEDVARELLPHYRDKQLIRAVWICRHQMRMKPEAAAQAAQELVKQIERIML